MSSHFAQVSVVVIAITQPRFDPTFIIPTENWKNDLSGFGDIGVLLHFHQSMTRPSFSPSYYTAEESFAICFNSLCQA